MANDITVKIGLTGAAQVTASLKQIQSSVQGAFGALKSLAVPLAGFASAGAFTAGLKGIVDLGGKIKNLSAETGVAADRLMVYRQAFASVGVGAEKVGESLAKVAKTVDEAFASGGAAEKGLTRIGLEVSDLVRMAPADQFDAIARAIGSLPTPTERTAVAMEIFGKSATGLIPLFRDGGAMQGAARVLGELPAVIARSKDTLDSIGSSIGNLGIKAQQFFAGFAEQFGPQVAEMLERVAGIDLTPLGRQFGSLVSVAIDAWQKGQFGQFIELSIQAAFEGAVSGIRRIWNALSSDLGVILFDGIWGALSGLSRIITKPIEWLAAAAAVFIDNFREGLGLIASLFGKDMPEKAFGFDEALQAVNETWTETMDNAGRTLRAAIGLQSTLTDTTDGHRTALERINQLMRERQAMTASSAPEHTMTITGTRMGVARSTGEQFGPPVADGFYDDSFRVQWLNAFREIKQEWGTVAQNIASVGKTAMQGLTRSMGNVLDDMIWRTNSLKDIWNSFAHLLTGAVTQAISNMFMKWISGIFAKKTATVAAESAETAAKAPTALMESIKSWGVAAALGVGAMVAAMAAFGGFRESGGPVTAGQAYVVGERRPELFVPNTSGVILPRADVPFAKQSGSSGDDERPVQIVVVDNRKQAADAARNPAFRTRIVEINSRDGWKGGA